MRYLALATDYDGTLAADGRVDEDSLAALNELLASGRKLIMVTGRRLDELQRVFPHLDLFDRVIAENGALLYRPKTKETELLGERPSERFVEALRARGVTDVDVGHVIVATWEPHEVTVLEVIREMGLGLQVIFNKGAVMVLPQGVTKATGLAAALAELGLSRHNVVGVGDAENDYAFLEQCGVAVAVDNALPPLKETCDITTRGARGAGVAELIREMIRDDLAGATTGLRRHRTTIGHTERGEVTVAPGENVLVAGPSGTGKSTVVTALLESLSDEGWQLCVIDPEGDYENLDFAVTLGKPDRAPARDEILDLLSTPDANAAVNLLDVSLADRPSFFAELLPALQEMRVETGRPHWIVIDEAHHLLPADWEQAPATLPQALRGTVFVTVHPAMMAPAALRSVDVAVVLGADPAQTLEGLTRATGRALPDGIPDDLEPGQALVWRPSEEHALVVQPARPRQERRRHRRKYAEGSVGERDAFYFRGPDGKLNLRAQNLVLFAQLAEGIDDETWLYHLRRGDYSTWFRDRIKDPELADIAAEQEGRQGPADETRTAILEAIHARYTASAGSPSGAVD